MVKSEQLAEDSVVEVRPGQTIGQSFVSDFDGLTGIEVQLYSNDLSQAVNLTLKTDPFDGEGLASSVVVLSTTNAAPYYRLSFPAQSNSYLNYYYLDIQVEGNANLGFASATGLSYLDGALYLDKIPQDSQLKFRLVYDPWLAGVGLAKELLIKWLGYFLIAILAFALPGWAILDLALGEPWKRLCFAEKLALSGGVSLALYPILMLLFDVVGVPLGELFAWIPVLASAGYLLFKSFRNGFQFPKIRTIRLRPEDAVFWILIVFIFGIRFWVIRSVEVPMWGDSYQHAMISQLIYDHGGLFDSWAPYEPYKSLTVQYGFSAGTAVWMWLTGQHSPLATLIYGQILNFFAILALYSLTLQVSKGNRWAANGSLLVGGLLSTHPAFYVNWGRYAQLAGQAVLPVSLSLLWIALEEKKVTLRSLLLNSFIVVGLLLSYYRMAFYYVFFVPILFLLLFVQQPPGQKNSFFKGAFFKLAGAALTSLVLFVPWIIRVSGSTLAEGVDKGMTLDLNAQSVLADYYIWQNLYEYLPQGLVIFIAAALLVSFFKRNWFAAGIILWFALISGWRAGAIFNLPGANFMQSFSVLISLYIPASIIIGMLFGWVVEWASRLNKRLGSAFGILLILSLALYGLNEQRTIVDPMTHAIVSRPDLNAMEWIRENTKEADVFLVEGFRINYGSSAVGSDGGWWIPLLTGRKNTMPPQYAMLNEQPNPPDYTKRVIDLVAKLETYSPVDPQMLPYFCDWGITHIYVGQSQGMTSMQKFQLFSPLTLYGSSLVKPVYTKDRVRIYKLATDVCNP